MAAGMPVLGQHQVGEALGEAVDDGDHLIAARDRETAARAEIVLHVDDEKHIASLAHETRHRCLQRLSVLRLLDGCGRQGRLGRSILGRFQAEMTVAGAGRGCLMIDRTEDMTIVQCGAREHPHVRRIIHAAHANMRLPEARDRPDHLKDQGGAIDALELLADAGILVGVPSCPL